MLLALAAFLTATGIAGLATPLVIRLACRYGLVAKPRHDRWHTRPTALLGGISLFLAFTLASLIFMPWQGSWLRFLLMAGLVFGLGLYDDLRELRPLTKLLWQILLAIATCWSGITIEIIPHPWLAFPLTVLWIVSITNAFNIIDNMDGLSSGITIVAASCISVFALINGLEGVPVLAAALAGAALGFLFYNFHPARIFMGDSGSLLLGYSLAIIALDGSWREATNLLFTIIPPVSFLIVPIFDATLVSVHRRIHGRPISLGGRDHTSHRLIGLGMSERQVFFILTSISLLFGLAGILSGIASIYSTLIIFSLLTTLLLLFWILLSEVKVYGDRTGSLRLREKAWLSFICSWKGLAQVAIDVVLICASYLASYLLWFQGEIDSGNLNLIKVSLPIVLLSKLSMGLAFKLYSGHWRPAGLLDLLRTCRALAAGSILAMGILLFLFRFESYSRRVFLLDFALSLLLLGSARLLTRFIGEYFGAVHRRLELTSREEQSGLPPGGDGSKTV